MLCFPSPVAISLSVTDSTFDVFCPICTSVLAEESQSKKVELLTA